MDRNSNKMLIDASHPEETRVVVLKNGRVEEFDFESAARKLLRGNIYLAKVTRVEPSLQAAFVDYGGNRHGFLAFNEIHPDYYQIPVADREALKQEEMEAEAAEEAEAEERHQRRGRRDRGGDRGDRHRRRDNGHGERHNGDQPAAELHTEGQPSLPEYTEPGSDPVAHTPAHPGDEPRDAQHAAPLAHDGAPGTAGDDRLVEPAAPVEAVERLDELRPADNITDVPEPIGNIEDQGVFEINGDNGNGEIEAVEEVTTEEDALEELPERPRRQRRRQYKIQEVIKRRQIILIQVVKEERGNKGAALTTYISLAGRYTVLMPNTGRGGGISRKITQPQDRKRLKAIAEELDVAEGMGLIIRTAGAARTKQEIKRDYEYLLRLWESVRDLTLASTAPCLVYEEGNLIKRSIRDLYSKDIDGVVVSGEVAHREARNFMTMLMPGHGDHVQRYEGSEPLFTRYGIERQLNAFFSPYVNLRSGGYLVINQTEALVSIDVNSGKSTREFSIEETALNTNLEAAEEIARQLKLRDLAGLIVVDFIDMEEKRNNRSVERRLKDSLRHDRARIQVGRISHFGLLEMSRQRLRTGMLEGSTSQCPHCQGTGIIRSVESVALAVLRGLEDSLMKQPSSLAAVTTAEVALYILNHKRHFINEMESRHGIAITIDSSDRMQGANFAIERTAAPVSAPSKPESRTAVSMDWGFDDEEGPREAAFDDRVANDRGTARDDDEGHDDRHGSSRPPHDDHGEPREARDEDGRPSRRRRRRRGRGRRDDGDRNGHGQPREHADADALGQDHEPRELSEHVVEHHDDYEPANAQVEPRPHVESRHHDDADDPRESDTMERNEGLAASGEAPEKVAEVHEPGSEDEQDRPRRGRRRGRRGGRGRSRDGRPFNRDEAGNGAREGEAGEGNEWGIAEVARQGADQPDGPPAEIAASWDSGFAPVATVPVRSAAPSEEPVSLHAADDAGHAPDVTSAPVREPLVSRVPVAENRAPVFDPPARTEDVAVEPPASAEPAPAPIVPKPAEPMAAAPAWPPVRDEPVLPARKGWWQRRFGAE